MKSNGARAAHGGRRTWLPGWCAGVLGAVLLVLIHADMSADYLTRVSETRLRGESPTVPLQRIPAAEAPDGQTWIRHALALAEGTDFRLRDTAIDNAPAGREVRWNSAWAWWLVGLGKARAVFTGEELTVAIERAAAWAQVPLLLFVVGAGAAWVGRRYGGWPAALTAPALCGHRGFYEGFLPGNPDHHGLINAAIFGLLLGAVFMGAGWWRQGSKLLPASREHARCAAWVSGICGGVALWVSAASAAVPIALIGVVGAVLTLSKGRGLVLDGATGAPEVWRLWSRAGAATAGVFYLIEYFPDGMGMRLEVNHPIYVLAWLGGGEGVALVMEWMRDKTTGLRTHFRVRLSLALTLAFAPVVFIAVGGAQWFLPADPFLARLHDQIDEFKPLWRLVEERGAWIFRDHLALHPWIFALALVAGWRARTEERAILGFCAGVTLVMTAGGWWQVRWMLPAGAAQVVLMITIWVVWAKSAGTPGTKVKNAVAYVCVCGWFYATSPWMFIHERRLVEEKRDVQMPEVMQLLYRDVAERLAKDRTPGEIVLLASPNASTATGYYGRFKTIGTLYWENGDGLKTAAEIFCAEDEGEAERLVRARGITHVVMFSAFGFLEEYFAALHPDRPLAEARARFGGRLLHERKIPVWLRPLAYEPPVQFGRFGFQVDVYAVDFGQKPAMAWYRAGLFQRARGALQSAEESFGRARSERDAPAQAWLREGELRTLRKDYAGAAGLFVEGIARSPADKRLGLYKSAMQLLMDAGAGKEALRLGRDAVAAGNHEALIPLARILATARDAEWRDGAEALRLAREAVKIMPAEPDAYAALAAALAETGDFGGANGALFQASEWSEGENNYDAEAAAYRRGRPWRQ